MIYLGGPWVWDGAGTPGPSYRAPAGTIAVVDLRTIPQQSVANHTNGAGNGFFAAPDGTPIPEGYEILATGDLRESVIGQPVRSAWQSIYGVPIPGDADRLIDCLSLTLGDMSDPTGDSGPKPLVPGVAPVGECCIHLAGHSVVYRRTLTVQTGGSQHARKLRDLLRRDLETIADNDPDPELWRRVLGFQKKKYGQAWDDDSEDWILSTKLKGKGKGKNGRTFADEPKSSYTETWPSNGTVTTGQNNGWSAFRSTDASIVSNQFNSGIASTWSWYRMTTALSGADMTSDFVYKSKTGDLAAGYAITRKDSSGTVTCYDAYWYNTTVSLEKLISGSSTSLGVVSDSSPSAGAVYKCSANGSAIKSIKDGVDKVSVTDTAITGNTYAGVGGYGGGVSYTHDDWACADLGGGPSRPDLGLLLGVS